MIEEKSYIATWCPVCDKQVSVEEQDTHRLLTHVRKYHPQITGKCLNNQKNGSLRISSNRISSPVTSVDSGKKNESKKVYATRVDTWKLHGERKVCPRCRREAVPTLHTRGDKLTTSHIGALCLFGAIRNRCWPFCFIPLMMKRAKRVRMICPLCGHVYGTFEYKNAKLTPCKPADAVGNSKAKAARFCNSQRAECKRSGPSQSGMLLPWIPTMKASDGKARAPKCRPNNVFSTKVETWKYHDKSIRCPACGVKEVPIILKQQKFTSSRLAAFCLLGCWPFCFIPLLMRRDKSVRTLCPHCGHDYGIRTRAESKLIACSPDCASSRGKLSDFANSRPCHLRMECGGSRVQPEHCQDRGSSYECSSDDCVDKKWDCRCNLNESKASKARGQSKSEDSAGTVDFYARQVCCRECG